MKTPAMKVRKAVDLEMHVRVIKLDDIEVVEMRDYIPSLKEYGRGYWVPKAAIKDVIDALVKAGNK